jgi:hypothetical protein
MLRVLGCLVASSVAQAATFNFQYRLKSGSTVAGSLVGELQSDGNTIAVASVVDVAFNGAASPALPFVDRYVQSLIATPSVTLDGKSMSLFAADIPQAACNACANFFVLGTIGGVPGLGLFIGGATYGGTTGQSFSESYSASSWSISEVEEDVEALPSSSEQPEAGDEAFSPSKLEGAGECADTTLGPFFAAEDLDAWTITEQDSGYMAHRPDIGAIMVANGAAHSDRGSRGAPGNSYITATVPVSAVPNDGSSSIVFVGVSATIMGRQLRTVGSACVFEASGDGGATWIPVVTVSGPGGDVPPTTGVAAGSGVAVSTAAGVGEVQLRLTAAATGRRARCFVLEATVTTCP